MKLSAIFTSQTAAVRQHMPALQLNQSIDRQASQPRVKGNAPVFQIVWQQPSRFDQRFLHHIRRINVAARGLDPCGLPPSSGYVPGATTSIAPRPRLRRGLLGQAAEWWLDRSSQVRLPNTDHAKRRGTLTPNWTISLRNQEIAQMGREVIPHANPAKHIGQMRHCSPSSEVQEYTKWRDQLNNLETILFIRVPRRLSRLGTTLSSCHESDRGSR